MKATHSLKSVFKSDGADMENDMETNSMKPAEFGAYMDAKQGAAYLTISKRHFDRLKARGQIPFKRLSPGCIRYRRADLDAFMAK